MCSRPSPVCAPRWPRSSEPRKNPRPRARNNPPATPAPSSWISLFTWWETPAQIETLWNFSLVRQPAQTLPPPSTPFWTPATRTLSTTALADGATRITAWRLAPGGAPEQLATGEMGALSVEIPDTITFTPGTEYQLWLQSRNATGHSDPSPITEWPA